MRYSAPLLFLPFLFCTVAFANNTYRTSKNSKDMIRFSIPYTLGTHTGTVKSVRGQVDTTDSDEVLGARFQVLIADMETGNKVRDCHMREALGLNYDESIFPKEHVCDSDSRLPNSGPDSVAYPAIMVDAIKMFSSAPFKEGVLTEDKMDFNISMHGVSKSFTSQNVMITKYLNEDKTYSFKVEMNLSLSLRDFRIVVKPFEIAFVSIGVGDTVTVNIDVILASRNVQLENRN